MTTVIDGRGNISRIENSSDITIEEEHSFAPMSIEEYRNLKLTPEQEWNNIYNPKKCSIEALEAIEIKKRGNGPDKPVYSVGSKEPGPYYDPDCAHIHIWKKVKLIQNFTCEQFHNVPYIQFTNKKPGLYCCICHERRKQFQFKWKENLDYPYEEPTIFHNKNKYNKEDFLPPSSVKVFPKTVTEVPVSNENNKKILNWERLVNRIFHSIYNEKLIYPISKYKSLYLWPWQLTAYQKFKLDNPEYKSSHIFVKSDLDKFKNNYAIIV
tara:strand:- start:8908 stop:9708 length:801 start_codon:yes stop_codon:yes gene_type:complete